MEKNHEIILMVASVFAMVICGTMFSISYAKLFEQLQASANYQADYLKNSDKYIYALYKGTQKKIWLFTVIAILTGFTTGISIIGFLLSLMLLNQPH